jgi:hypothetical protein
MALDKEEGWRHIQNLCRFSTPTAMGQSFIMTLYFLENFFLYYWGHGKLGRCVIQLSKFLNHTLATHNQVDSFFENINHNDGKGALFEMTITDCPGFDVPHCTTDIKSNVFSGS